MFGKIKGKLNSIFKKNEEIIEEEILDNNLKENVDEEESFEDLEKLKNENSKDEFENKDTQEKDKTLDVGFEEELGEDKEEISKQEIVSFEEKKQKEKEEYEEDEENLEFVENQENSQNKILEEEQEKTKQETQKETQQYNEQSKEEIEEITSLEEEKELEEVKDVEEKKGFFKRFFSKKKEETEEEEIKEVEEDLLDGVEEEEKVLLHEKKDFPQDFTKEKTRELDLKLEKEEFEEKEELLDVEFSKKDIGEEKKVEINTQQINNLNDSKEESLKEIKNDKFQYSSSSKISQKLEEEKKKDDESGFVSKVFSKIKKKEIKDEDFEKIWVELELFLLEINIAFEIVEKIEEKLKSALIGNSFSRFSMSEKIREIMVCEVEEVLEQREGDFIQEIKKYREKGEVLKILILGVNGTGKTTSIAKIIQFLKNNNFSVVVAASDTFRAAAVEQLDLHCKNLDVKLIQHQSGSDPAAVAYDAVEHAKARKIDIVLIDTAGRMPNNSNLMMELQKVKRVSSSQMSIFIGDSISGNDLIEQINLFDKALGVSGVILTKVDTDERPGSVVTTAYSIDRPIYFLGIGQNYDDLVEFKAREIAEKLFVLED